MQKIKKNFLTPLSSLGLFLNFSSALSGPPNCTNKLLKALSVGAKIVYGPVSFKIESKPDCFKYLAIACSPLFFKIFDNSFKLVDTSEVSLGSGSKMLSLSINCSVVSVGVCLVVVCGTVVVRGRVRAVFCVCDVVRVEYGEAVDAVDSKLNRLDE